jgi:N-carbamoyl-L-amino-acid hydrolase
VIDQWEVTVEGFANHAGTTPMDQRHDALLAAARFVEAVNRVVRGAPGRQVGTVGRIQAFPGAPNVIPGKVVLSLELRDLDAAKIRTLYDRIHAAADAIAKDSGTTFTFRPTVENVPAPTDPRVRRVIAESARALGLSTKSLPSGAGHDAQDLARIAPTGMIFIPSVGGISHSPRELSRPTDVENGANVLLESVVRLDTEF